MSLSYSEIESNRFGLNIYRSKIENFKVSDLKKQIIENNVDILMLRMPSTKKSHHHDLEKMGFDFIHADTLVYYISDLFKYDFKKIKNEVKFERVTNTNSDIFNEIIPIIFKNYQNHYFSNSLLAHNKINEGYIEWAKSYSKNDKEKVSWFVYKNNKIAGFATCSFNHNEKTCEGVLYGVMPEFSGQGIYADLIRFTQNYFKEQGFEKMYVSTQVQNYAVQKVWSREGFYLTNSFETYHINSLLSYTCVPKIKSIINIKENQLDEFANFSKDYNEIHFNSEKAKKIGFEDRIVHGMIILSHISKVIGTEYPGFGSIYINNKNLFLAPIYLNSDYDLEVSTLNQQENGIFNLLFKVSDNKSKLCLLSYNTVIKK